MPLGKPLPSWKRKSPRVEIIDLGKNGPTLLDRQRSGSPFDGTSSRFNRMGASREMEEDSFAKVHQFINRS